MTTGPERALRVLVCLPTYNEADNIVGVIGEIRRLQPQVDVLVIDDGSPDGTGDIADALTEQDDRVHVLLRTRKEGLGRAYLAGFAWAAEHGFDVVVEMDADGSHRPQDLGGLLDAVDAGADLALGSRWTIGGAVRNWAPHRVLLSRAGSAYARTLLRLPERDVTGGFRAMRLDALARLDLGSVRSQGYCFQIDLVRRAERAGLTVREVPITFLERRQGVSKMSSGIVVEAVLQVTRWAIEDAVPALRGGGAGRGGVQALPHR